jgi:hypothetical protein
MSTDDNEMLEQSGSNDPNQSLLSQTGSVQDTSRRLVASAQNEFQIAAEGAAFSAAKAGRSANRISFANLENLSEVHIGLCATVAMVLVIWMVCIPMFDMSTVEWMRSWEHLGGSQHNVTHIMVPWRNQVLDSFSTGEKAFDAFDTNHNGVLDHSEFVENSKRIGSLMGEDTAMRLFDHIDSEESGVITRADFLSALTPGARPHGILHELKEGSTTIDVEDESDFQIGDRIKLAAPDNTVEVVTVVGMGSLIVDPPLKHSYSGDSTVTFVSHVTQTTTTVTTTTRTTTTLTTTTAVDRRALAARRLRALVGFVLA